MLCCAQIRIVVCHHWYEHLHTCKVNTSKIADAAPNIAHKILPTLDIKLNLNPHGLKK